MPVKYTPELKQRAIELVLHAQSDPVTARSAVTRIAAELARVFHGDQLTRPRQ